MVFLLLRLLVYIVIASTIFAKPYHSKSIVWLQFDTFVPIYLNIFIVGRQAPWTTLLQVWIMKYCYKTILAESGKPFMIMTDSYFPFVLKMNIICNIRNFLTALNATEYVAT